MPDLSVVVTSRNDNHGGNLLERMQLFVNGLLTQCKQYQLNTELVLVEWNPPADRPKLSETLFWSSNFESCDVRIIEIPPEIHQRFKHSDQLPLFQMIGKNVGVRRAHGQFILATNIDILFSDQLIQFLASGRLRKDRMYRVDRYDVPESVPLHAPLADQLDYCRRHVMRIYAPDGLNDLQTGIYHKIYPKLTVFEWLREKRQDWQLTPVTKRCRLHTMACGDFTLMDRRHWLAVRGYPEFEMYSMHLDSVLCYAAHHSGARERILRKPMVIYHIEHGIGSGWTPEGQQALNERLETDGILQLSWDQVNSWAIQMRRERKPLIFNNENWGLAGENLPEITL